MPRRAALPLIAATAALAGLGGCSEPTWEAFHTWVVDGELAVARDIQPSRDRLTTLDLRDGRVIARRDFPLVTLCLALERGRLLCNDPLRVFVLDARTLQETLDVGALIRRTLPGAAVGRHTGRKLAVRLGDKVEVPTDEQQGVAVVDLKRQQVQVGAGRSGEQFSAEPSYCHAAAELTRHGTDWRELACTPPGGGRYALRIGQLASLAPDSTERWTTSLAGAITGLWQPGDQLIAASEDPTARVVALDPATGAIRWRVAR